MSILLFICVILLSVLPCNILRSRIIKAAFPQHNAKHIKSRLEPHTLFDRFTLMSVVKEYQACGKRGGYRKVLPYWLYLLVVLLAAAVIAISANSAALKSSGIPLISFFVLLLIHVIVWLSWSVKSKF